MTESNQGPATPGTAARCEPEMLVRLHELAEEALRGKYHFGEPPHMTLDPGLLIDVLGDLAAAQAENASLLGSLRQWKKDCEDYSGCVARMEEKLAAAEQRNTALEGALRRAAGDLDAGAQWLEAHDRIAASSLKDEATTARAALHDEERPCLCHQGIAPDTCPYHGPLLRADEERSAPGIAASAAPAASVPKTAAQGEEK